MALELGVDDVLGLTVALLALLAPQAPRLDASASVFVQAREAGQGLLRGRGSECFVVTPAHVIDKVVGTVRVTGERSAQASSSVERSFAGDVAVLRVTTGNTLTCPEWPTVDMTALLTGRDSGTLSMREANGSRTLMPVSFTALDEELIYVRPTRPGDVIAKSMSGGSLLVDGRVAGILLRVEDNVGEVYQIDDVMRVSTEFFVPSAKPVSAASSAVTGRYNFGGVDVLIQPSGAGLQYVQAGSPIHILTAGADGSFTSPTIPGGTIEFRKDESGAIDSLYLKVQQAVMHAPRVDGPAPDAATLRSLVGTYVINPAVTVVVAQRPDGVLTYRGTLEKVDSVLLPARGLHFAFQGNLFVSAVFHRDAAGTVTHMVVYAADTSVVATRRR